jgi:phosphorylase kinase alpha/beta subunit
VIITQLVDKGFIRTTDIDPLMSYNNKRSERNKLSSNERLIQVALVAENTKLRTLLSTFGIESETPEQLDPIVIWPSQGYC